MSVYKNGNTIVEIRRDGTKIRYTPDNQKPAPLYPESIDLKICNRCEIGCSICHEQSTPDGKMGDLSHPVLNSIHAYTELAIGGGDPLLHPGLEEFLVRMWFKKVICNITVHWKSFMENLNKLHRWTEENLIHGLGISINSEVPKEVIKEISKLDHAVVHTVIGVADESVYRQLAGNDLNILFLGYKTFGRGIRYRTEESSSIDVNTSFLRENIRRFPSYFKAVCFDNLAIQQLNIERKMNPEMYSQMYMGGDGTFTMYLDLVENKYAVSSISPRYDIDENNIDDLFRKVRGIANK